MKPSENASGSTGPSTRAVHAGSEHAAPGQPVVTPIYQAATFFTDAEPVGDVRYTRYGTNPNHLVLAEKICALENAEAAIVLASGNAAAALAMLTVAGAGDHIVAAAELYGGTLRIMNRELPRLGVETTFVQRGGDFSSAIRPSTKAIWLEVPVNPTLRIPDIRPIAALARERGIPLIVDATFATPINFRPLEHGAALVIHSATKYLGGHSDVTAGVVAGRKDLVAEVREKLKSFGPVLDPHATWLLERGIKTLSVRMERHNANGMAVARWLSTSPAVEVVHYPGLPSHPDHAIASELLDGFGGMVSLVVRGGDEAALRVVNRLRMMCVAPSLGGVETLVSMPIFTSHAALTRAQRNELGIADGFIRLSLGIEDPADLIADLAQALAPELQHAAAPAALVTSASNE
ncbi:MAG: aminotransferase class I/II-fold pyridoxal phosphate-dependent enzyme [Longimicrobiales bacterium]